MLSLRNDTTWRTCGVLHALNQRQTRPPVRDRSTTEHAVHLDHDIALGSLHVYQHECSVSANRYGLFCAKHVWRSLGHASLGNTKIE